MVPFQEAFPPAEKDFDFPAQLINGGDLLGGKIIPIGGDPVGLGAHPVGNHPDFFLGLVHPGGAQETKGVIEDNAARFGFQGSEDFFCRAGLNPADKILLLFLPEGKIFRHW
jgi:hypothetical protein